MYASKEQTNFPAGRCQEADFGRGKKGNLRQLCAALLVSVICFATLAGCAQKKDSSEDTALPPLETANVGVMTGTTGELIISSDYPNAKISSFDAAPDGIASLLGGRIDYFIGSYAPMLNFTKYNPELMLVPGNMKDGDNAVAFRKGDTRYLSKVNDVINELKADGTLAEMEKRWLKTDNTPYVPVEIPKHENGEVMRVAISADREPMCFVQDGAFVGFDCELAERIADKLGMRLEHQNMKFTALITSLQAGKSDMIISNLTRTEERAQSVDFSVPYFDNPQVLITKKPAGTVEAKNTNWIESFQESFQKTFIVENRYLLILEGLGTTLTVSIFAALFGTMLGFVICMLRRSKFYWLNTPAKLFIRLVQGVPIVVILMILFYIIFTNPNTNAVVVAIIGFSINFAAYVSEMMRTGIDAVDKGQMEAASAIGFNKLQVFCEITLPQALRHVLPVFKGEFISMIKMTSVVGYIALQDLTKASDIIRSRTYEAFFPLIVTAIIYFTISYLMTVLLTVIEIKIDPRHRKRAVKGVQEQ